MILESSVVHDLFISCLFREGENTNIRVEAKGVNIHAGFHPDRIEQATEKIKELFAELDESFQETGGKGMTFLNMCNDKHGNQWTDFHQRMDELVCLGLATKVIEFTLPRELWLMLPSGMPYIVVKNKKGKPKHQKQSKEN